MSEKNLAPNEKHLEDYIWARPEALGMMGIPDYAGGDRPIFDFKLRQFCLPSGIADLIGTYFHHFAVIEIKKGVIDTRTLAQLLRYMRDIQAIWTFVKQQYWDERREMFEYLEHCDVTNGYSFDHLIRGVLIGHEILDPNLVIACEAAGVDFVLYDWNDGAYSFDTCINHPLWSAERYEYYQALSRGNMGRVMHDVIRDEVKYLHAMASARKTFSAPDRAEEHIESLAGGTS